jgi:hypothetical protein
MGKASRVCGFFVLLLSVVSVHAATLVVKVVLHTPPPPPKVINTNADPYCTSVHKTDKLTSEEVLANPDGTLREAFVFLGAGVTGTYPPPKAAVLLDQVGCHYVPHVVGLIAGQPLMIRNSDSTLHNIHPLPKLNTPFNIGMPTKGMQQARYFPKPERPFHVKCDIHQWMSSYVAVFSHPFFGVTNEHGVVELANVPAGTYTVESWQEKYGSKSQTVTVTATDRKELVFTY